MKINRALRMINLAIMCFALSCLYGIIEKMIDLNKWYGIGWQLNSSLCVTTFFWIFVIVICLGVANGNKIAMCFPPIICSVVIGFFVMAAISSGWINVPNVIVISAPFILWGYCAWVWIINQRRA